MYKYHEYKEQIEKYFLDKSNFEFHKGYSKRHPNYDCDDLFEFILLDNISLKGYVEDLMFFNTSCHRKDVFEFIKKDIKPTLEIFLSHKDVVSLYCQIKYK
jgi:hypothetical protein